MDTRYWRTADNSTDMMAIFTAVLTAAVGIFLLLYNNVVLAIIMFILAVFVWITMYQQRRPSASKVFLVHPSLGRQVVEAVLNDKGIAYKQMPDQFNLEGSDLIISIKPVSIDRYATTTVTLITLTPSNTENEPLIKSLCHKIDEAFLPKGL